MAKFQVRSKVTDGWEDSLPIPELKSLFEALRDEEDLVVVVGRAEWRVKPVDPELERDIREAIVLNDYTTNQVDGVVRVLRHHDLI